MLNTCVDYVLTHLSSMEKLELLDLSYSSNLKINLKIKAFQAELRFIRMFLLCFPQRDCDANVHVNLIALVTCIAELFKIETTDTSAKFVVVLTEMDSVEDKIRECKAEIKRYREQLISCSLKGKPFTRNETMKFLDYVHVNIQDLVKFGVDGFLHMKSRIETLEEMVFLLKNLVYFTPMCGENREEPFVFEFNVQDWAYKAVCLILLRWLNETEDEEKIRLLHIDLRQKFNPCNPDFVRFCFEVIKVPKLKRSETLVFGEFVTRFVDLFMDYYLVLILNDDVRMIREGLILLITFLVDSRAKSIRKQIFAVLDQASHTICFLSETDMDLARGKDDLRKSIDEVRGKIENLYIHIPHSSWSNFPRINGLGYFESLLVYLENLKEAMNKNKKLVPYLKHQIFTIQEELLPLRPFLHDIATILNENRELKDLWEKIISLLYQADLAIKSSFFIDHPIWYNITRLSFVVGKIKDIRYKVMRIQIEGSRTNTTPPLMSSVDVLRPPTSTSIVDAVVGFKHEIEVLIDRLIKGTAQLDIVSIVGMGGIGKTTLTKKLFNEPLVTYYFHKRAFCSVSQEYSKKNVLLDILSDLCLLDGEVRQMSDDDLAHMLYKSLKGFKYLVVMDDIWDINAWHDLRASFPDDKNGSRIIFTTRISNISLLAKSDSTPYLLSFLSVDESWQLLQQKIFFKDPCPIHLREVGRLIAQNCQGLPLAILVIAGLLVRTKRSLHEWYEVAVTLSAFASSERCKGIIHLSYKQLPEALKSCFLYLGAFYEDEILEAKRLTMLWVAEGFVLKSGSKSLYKVAKTYLNDLRDRNLVTVTQLSCNGGIKRFQVHDLIRDFCRTEAREEHYLCFIYELNNDFMVPYVFDQYRVCIEAECGSFNDAKPRAHTVHSLLYLCEAYHEENSLRSFLRNFKLVQVLDLQEVEIVGKFPTTITTLIHLRYLTLRLLTPKYVPPEISNLWNLETLLLLASPTYLARTRFPIDIWKMKRLRHVEAGHWAVIDLDDVTGVFPQLPDLETLTSLYIPPGNDGEKLLRRLSNVRKLSCICGEWWDQRRECNQLPKLEILTNLESLKMICEKSLTKVRQPYMFSFPSTIRKLTLKEFRLPWSELSDIIVKLPCLQVLVLLKQSFKGKIWDVQDEEFPNIKSLTIDDLDIEEWKASTDSFPCLEKLNVFFCTSLIKIPPCFGEVVTLNLIHIEYCEKGVVDSAIQIQNDQLDSGNQTFEVDVALNPQ